MDTPQRNPETPSSASSQDRQRIRHRERISLVKNRMREFRTSRSARDGDGNVPIYSAMTPYRKLLNTKHTRANNALRKDFPV